MCYLRVVLILLVSCAYLTGFAQRSSISLERDVYQKFELNATNPEVSWHSSIRPFDLSEFDSITGFELRQFPSLMDRWADSSSNSEFFVALSPLINLNQTSIQNDTLHSSLLSAGAGLALNSKLGRKIGLEGHFYTENASYPAYLRHLIDSIKVVPGMGYASATNLGQSFTNYGLRLRYRANRFFRFELGKGKHFFGNGYRSMLLSDNAANYPFFNIHTSFWKIRYVNLYTALQDFSVNPADFAARRKKFMVSHYLSWDISKRFNLSFFEAIIWPGQDSLLSRGFEVNYLNPIIFFRPVEYAQGSADNALLGLNASLKIPGNVQLYAQLLLDEFLLDELRADIRHTLAPTDSSFNYGWWANKFGFQLGAKAFDIAGIRNLDAQTEINLARPFTYSHGSVIQNYGHYGQPMAHPLGANFKEWVSFINYYSGKFHLQAQFNIATFGSDTSGVNKGGNIFLSYNSRESEYNHFINQGLKNRLFFSQLTGSYLIDAESNLRLQLSISHRGIRNELSTDKTTFISIGVRSSIGNRYHDY